MRVTSDMHSLPVSSSWLRATPAIELGRCRGECKPRRLLDDRGCSWDRGCHGCFTDTLPSRSRAFPSKNRDGLQSRWEAVVPDAPKPIPDLISLQSTPRDPKASLGAL